MEASTDRKRVKFKDRPNLVGTTSLQFVDYPELKPFVWKTWELGIARLGTLLQMKEEDVFRAVPVSDKHRRLIKEHLANCGMSFGMIIEGWVDPDIDLTDDVTRH